MPAYKGHCHCRALGYTYTCDVPPEAWSVRACQCSFCRKHAALSTSAPGATIMIEVADDAAPERYRFGLETADFLVCRRCGVYIGAVIETSRGRFGIVNTRTLADSVPPTATPVPVSYDEEDTAGRIARREDRWARVTEFPE